MCPRHSESADLVRVWEVINLYVVTIKNQCYLLPDSFYRRPREFPRFAVFLRLCAEPWKLHVELSEGLPMWSQVAEAVIHRVRWVKIVRI